MKTYFGVFKKFHAKDLPKTNYDLLYEERVNLDSEFCEFELLELIQKHYTEVLCQQSAL